MAAEVLYEITRTWAREITDEGQASFGDVVEVTESVRLIGAGGSYSCVVNGHDEIPCEGSTADAAIAATPILHEIRPDQVTRISALPEVAQHLPLVLVPTGEWGDHDSSPWPESMYELISEEVSSALPHDIYRVLYVNESRWYMFHTNRGYSMLPGSIGEVALERTWAHASLYEVAEMNSGNNRNALGLLTPVVIAEVDAPDTDGIYPEEGSTRIHLSRWEGDVETAAKNLADWVIGSPVSFFLYGDNGDEADPKYFVQLFVEAALSDDGSAVRYAEEFVELTGYDLGYVADSSTARFMMALDVERVILDKALELVAAANPQYRDMIRAALDPESPEAKARDARLAEIYNLD